MKSYEAVLGRNHPKTVTGIGNLACAYRDRGQYPLARRLLEECINQSVPGDSGGLDRRINLASVYMGEGKVRQAIAVLEESLRL